MRWLIAIELLIVFKFLLVLASVNVKPGAHERKQLSKKSCEAVSSAVSSRVRVNFGEIFASRGRETNI